jgi:putative membrane protein insertion efficiency factor
VRTVLLALLAFYKRVVSPLLPVACRFHPTCSAYAAEAVRRHGAWRGARLTAARLWRCRPGGGGGDDPVPEA